MKRVCRTGRKGLNRDAMVVGVGRRDDCADNIDERGRKAVEIDREDMRAVVTGRRGNEVGRVGRVRRGRRRGNVRGILLA